MHEVKSRAVERILDRDGSNEKSFTKERQQTAQAFNLHVEKRDGLHSEGFAWSHYARYTWTDEGQHERLVILLGGAGAVEIEGHNLGPLIAEIRECRLTGVQEMVSAHAALKFHDGADGPIINSVKMYPDFEEIFREIKGEDEHDKGKHVGRIR